MLELNNVKLRSTPASLTMMANEGQLTVLPLPASQSSRWLQAVLGFEPVVEGFVSVDGEPLTVETAPVLRRLMAWVPASLEPVGQVVTYTPPTVQEVFALRVNRQLAISNGMLSEEMRRTGVTGGYGRLLAVAVLLKRPILLVDQPPTVAADYLRRQAEAGVTVIVGTTDKTFLSMADQVVDIKIPAMT